MSQLAFDIHEPNQKNHTRGIIEPSNCVKREFQIQYEHPNGCLYQGNSIDWLASLESASVDLVFADPPYNINKADWDSFESQEKYIE